MVPPRFPLPRAVLAAALLALAAPAAGLGAAWAQAVAPADRFEADRRAILAMAGDYRVRFEFRETAAFVEGYALAEPKRTGGYEAVRVIEDSGRTIRLQHLLVVEGEDERPMVVKHWRQDWIYEPAKVLAYADRNEWRERSVETGERAGAWSQTVWQTDDSPRYGGVGRWRHEEGVSRWTSEETARPLARRDAVEKPPYDRYVGRNRHALTPTGWIHEQDNAKSGLKDGRRTLIAQETAINTYTRNADFPAKAADDYWAATADYWADVRAEWDRLLEREGAIRVAEVAAFGSATVPVLMGLADQAASGAKTRAAASAEARAVIAQDAARGVALAATR